MTGSFGFGGDQRSYSFGCFHADIIPNETLATYMPNLECEWACIKNRPDSTGNAYIGSQRLSVVGTGVYLEPGEITGWIPVTNLNLIWHKEDDATTNLEYMVIGCNYPQYVNLILPVLLQENGAPLLLEDGDEIAL